MGISFSASNYGTEKTYLIGTGLPITTPPYTIAVRVRDQQPGVGKAYVSINSAGNPTGAPYLTMWYNSAILTADATSNGIYSEYTVQTGSVTDPINSVIASAVETPASRWAHYPRGGFATQDTFDNTPYNGTIDTLVVGKGYANGGFLQNYCPDNLEWVAVWAENLTASELLAIDNGLDPRKVKPSTLVFLDFANSDNVSAPIARGASQFALRLAYDGTALACRHLPNLSLTSWPTHTVGSTASLVSISAPASHPVFKPAIRFFNRRF